MTGLVLAVAGSAGAEEIGKVLYEYFLDIGGSTVVMELTGNTKWTDGVDLSECTSGLRSRVEEI